MRVGKGPVSRIPRWILRRAWQQEREAQHGLKLRGEGKRFLSTIRTRRHRNLNEGPFALLFVNTVALEQQPPCASSVTGLIRFLGSPMIRRLPDWILPRFAPSLPCWLRGLEVRILPFRDFHEALFFPPLCPPCEDCREIACRPCWVPCPPFPVLSLHAHSRALLLPMRRAQHQSYSVKAGHGGRAHTVAQF